MRRPITSSFRARRPLFAVLAAVNFGGLFAAVYMPFLPNENGLAVASIFAMGCVVATIAHIRQGFRESVTDESIASELESAGTMRHPWFFSTVFVIFFGVLGLNAAVYFLAGTYTRLFGSPETQSFTVTSSVVRTRGRGLCYRTRFAERAAVFQLWPAYCLPMHVPVGGTVLVSGYSTRLGIYVEGIRLNVTESR